MDIRKIFLIGMPATGKTTLGKFLASHYRSPWFDLDDIIIQRYKATVQQIFDQKGEFFFRKIEHQTLQKIIDQYPYFIMAVGGGTPYFYDNLHLMNQRGVTIFLHTPLIHLVKRLTKQQLLHRPLLGNTDRVDFVLYQLFQKRIKKYAQAHFTFNFQSICSLYHRYNKIQTKSFNNYSKEVSAMQRR